MKTVFKISQTVFLVSGEYNVDSKTVSCSEEGTQFEQVLRYLHKKDDPSTTWEGQIIEGLGRLFLFGSFLSFLSDSNKTDHPELNNSRVSLINGSEMKRINIELSFIAEQMLRWRLNDQIILNNYGQKAFELFPFGCEYRKATQKMRSYVQNVYSDLSSLPYDSSLYQHTPERIDDIKKYSGALYQNPFRAVAHKLVNSLYRRGATSIIEDLHTGRRPDTYPGIEYRRIGENDLFLIHNCLVYLAYAIYTIPKEIIHQTTWENVIGRGLYPINWDLESKTSSVIY